MTAPKHQIAVGLYTDHDGYVRWLYSSARLWRRQAQYMPGRLDQGAREWAETIERTAWQQAAIPEHECPVCRGSS